MKKLLYGIRMGGKATYEQFQELESDKQDWLIEQLNKHNNTCFDIELDNKIICLAHAGIESKELKNCPNHLWHVKINNWNRNHLREQHWQGPEDAYLIHGHTPTVYNKYFDYTKPKVIRYCDNHKIDIDTCAWYTGIAALLDMYTFEPIYFKGESLEENG